jgi:hypothetical protein
VQTQATTRWPALRHRRTANISPRQHYQCHGHYCGKQGVRRHYRRHAQHDRRDIRRSVGRGPVERRYCHRHVADKNAAAGKNVAIGSIALGGADAGNYTLANNTATATANITRASLTITANDQVKVFGAANPALTLSYRGFVAGENASVLTTQPTASTIADTTSPVGNYAITASGAAGQNYVFTYVPGTLSVFNNTPSPGYVGALSYVDSVGSEEADDGEDRLKVNALLVQIRDGGIRLPAGVQ